MILVTDLQYFSSIIYYKELSKFSYCLLDQYDYHRKMSFRNRCTLSGANGTVSLSIPLLGGRNQKTIAKEVKIENKENWQARHWKTIVSCYNKSPWFDHYRDDLNVLYSKNYNYLFDWNVACMKWVCDKMSLKTVISLSESYMKTYDPTTFEDQRNRYLPATISKITLSAERYPQVFEERSGFIPNLSILDKLFCAGNIL
jgi:hypothetical protein